MAFWEPKVTKRRTSVGSMMARHFIERLDQGVMIDRTKPPRSGGVRTRMVAPKVFRRLAS